MRADRKEFMYPDIMFVCKTTGKDYDREEFVRDHVLCYIVSGEMRMIDATAQRIFRAGDAMLLRRNYLVKAEKRSLKDVPFQCIFLVFNQQFAEEYALGKGISTPAPDPEYAQQYLQILRPSAALEGLFSSLQPYINNAVHLSPAMMRLKLQEAMLCLLEQDNRLANWFFDFAEPGKIDIETFMHRNYMFNIPVSKFAALTGRSISTFQRDFNRHFGMPVSVWLLKRRLEAAHEALLRPGTKPSDIYLEVGFEDLAHFSKAFKKVYGYNPSTLKV